MTRLNNKENFYSTQFWASKRFSLLINKISYLLFLPFWQDSIFRKTSRTQEIPEVVICSQQCWLNALPSHLWSDQLLMYMYIVLLLAILSIKLVDGVEVRLTKGENTLLYIKSNQNIQSSWRWCTKTIILQSNLVERISSWDFTSLWKQLPLPANWRLSWTYQYTL